MYAEATQTVRHICVFLFFSVDSLSSYSELRVSYLQLAYYLNFSVTGWWKENSFCQFFYFERGFNCDAGFAIVNIAWIKSIKIAKIVDDTNSPLLYFELSPTS